MNNKKKQANPPVTSRRKKCFFNPVSLSRVEHLHINKINIVSLRPCAKKKAGLL